MGRPAARRAFFRAGCVGGRSRRRSNDSSAWLFAGHGWRRRIGRATSAREGETESYSAARHVARLSVGGRAVLHDGARQLLFELNETADLIWQGLTSEAGEAQAIGRLTPRGLAPAEARTYVREAARSWMTAGQIAPRSALRALALPPDDLRRLSLHELSLEVAFHGVSAAACDLVAGAFQADGGAPKDRLAIVAHRGLFLFFLNGEIRCGCKAGGLAAQLKATLTELYVAAVDKAFLAHGAMVCREGFGLFLSGAPGAGKTTLALALAGAGWTYGGDDIVRVSPDGRASPVPFAAGVKAGAWPLLARMWPGIVDLTTWTRADGQSVRYFTPPGAAERAARALDAVVVLARQDGAPAALHPISPVEALRALLESGYAARWALTGEALAALAARLERAQCRRLVYSDLGDAAGVLEALRLGQA